MESRLTTSLGALAQLFRIDGKRALIVGGYGGIGRPISELFTVAGGTLAIGGRSLEQAEEAAAALSPTSIGVKVDLTDREGVGAAVSEVAKRLGGLDIVVNLAGIEMHGPAADVTEEVWQASQDVNISGAFWLAQAAGKSMIEAGEGGRIILFSSTRGALGGRRGFAAYGTAKAAVNLLVKQLATEWGAHGITVNAVAPGIVPTPMMLEAAADDQFVAMVRGRIPLGRFAEPLEMAGATLFLAAPAASYVTGQVLYVDGGVTASS